MRKEIVQIDLVINWGWNRSDHICRHLVVTNMLGEREWIDISTLLPTPITRKQDKRPDKLANVLSNFIVKLKERLFSKKSTSKLPVMMEGTKLEVSFFK